MALKTARRAAIPPFFVMEVMRAACEREAAGGDVLHLEVGQPSTAAPAKVIAAAKAAVETERLGYTEALGTPALRTAIARHYRRAYGLDLPPRRVVVTAGSSGGFVLAFLAAFEAGDRVAMATPGYPCYRNILTALGVEPVEIPVGPETRFQPTPELLAAAGQLDGLVIASPANPTGTMLEPHEMEDLLDYCVAKGIRIISDEIYHGITYGRAADTMLSITDDAVIVNSFSKYFSMTGWRLGWLVVPEMLVRPIECLAQNLFISAPSLSQAAAVAAFDCREELDGHVARYASNRALLLEELPKAGLDRLAPADGAFYLYADVSALTDDSEAWCRQLLAETGVAITPGIDFDPVRGRQFVRLSFAGSTETIADAAKRLRGWV
ncbi:MAG: pyridoxal phosphate-dependent aminotransferase [Rhodospirillaceae bacterium]